MGRPPDVPDEEFLREIALSPDPIVTATELADTLDMSQQGAFRRLKNMEEEGLIRSKKVGSRARVWWLTDVGRQRLHQDESDVREEGT